MKKMVMILGCTVMFALMAAQAGTNNVDIVTAARGRKRKTAFSPIP